MSVCLLSSILATDLDFNCQGKVTHSTFGISKQLEKIGTYRESPKQMKQICLFAIIEQYNLVGKFL